MKNIGSLSLCRIAVLIMGLFMCTACNSDKQTAQPKKTKDRVVNLAIWSSYLTEKAQKEFTQKTGIQLNVTNYSSNEELLAKVQNGNSGIDVIVPSDYMVDIMVKSNLLQPLEVAKVENFNLISEDYLKQDFDPQNKYSLPYAWSTAGLAVNTKLFKGTIKSWVDVFQNKELEGKISLLDDVREVMAAALKVNGASVNSVNPSEIAKAKKTLQDWRKKVKMFRSETIDLLISGQVLVAHSYSTDTLQAAARAPGEIQYILPTEGGTRAIDNLAILRGAQNLEEAHQLINFLLSADTNVAFTKSILAGPVLKQTRALLPEELQANEALFPTPQTLSKLEKIRDLGDDTKVYDRVWTELKVQ